MKKTIITTLKFLKNKLEIEAVEQIGTRVISIFKNSINSLENDDYQQKLFIKNSKSEIEKSIKGKISDVIVLVSLDYGEKININTVRLSLAKDLNADIFAYNKIVENTYLENGKKIIKNINIDFIEKSKTVELTSIIATLDLEFEQKINEFASQNHLNVAQILSYEEVKANHYNLENANLYVDLSNSSLVLTLMNSKNIILDSIYSFGTDDFATLLMTKYSLKTPLAYFAKNLGLTGNFQNFVANKLSNDDLKIETLNFYSKIIEAINDFTTINNLDSNMQRLNINFYGELKNNITFENYAKQILNKHNVYSLDPKNEFITDEMLGMLALLNENDQDSLVTTDTFTIDSDILRNIKISKRKSIFV